MRDQIEKTIEEMEYLVMQMYRSASNLDELVQSIRQEGISNIGSEKYLDVFIKAQRNYREDMLKIKFFRLENREEHLWRKLSTIEEA